VAHHLDGDGVRDSGGEHESCRAVSELMEPDVRKTGPPSETCSRPACEEHLSTGTPGMCWNPYRQGREAMAKVSPYYSSNPSDPDVYHDHDDCPTGQQIPPQNKLPGTGGYRRCHQCEAKG
jgi:hypothetical protein